MSRGRRPALALPRAWTLATALSAGGVSAQGLRAPISPSEPHAFELELYRTRFDQEIAFRAAAVHVAWGAEALCDHTIEIEPFVLWSVHAMRRRLSGWDEALFRRATGMDETWRVAWVDESAPDELRVGDVVVAINGLPLPEGSTRMSLGAVFGTFFVAGATAVGRQQEAEDVGTAFTVGQVLAMAVPGVGMLLSAAEARTERAVTVDGIAGRADLFANEVVVALGGDPEAGLRLARRIRALGLQADVLSLSEFRLSSMAEHVQRLRELARAQAEVPR